MNDSATETEHARVVVPPLGHFLWIQNHSDEDDWFTVTAQGGDQRIVRIGPHRVVRYGPFLEQYEFACVPSYRIAMAALVPEQEPSWLDAGADVVHVAPDVLFSGSR
jgi:hypothetical protein